MSFKSRLPSIMLCAACLNNSRNASSRGIKPNNITLPSAGEPCLYDAGGAESCRTPTRIDFHHLISPEAHVNPPPKLPSSTISFGGTLPDRTAWYSAMGSEAEDVLP